MADCLVFGLAEPGTAHLNMQPQTERLGVAALDYFFSANGWMFREQTTHDYGIDAHVEIVQDGRPTGKLIALQIKSGISFFSEETEAGYVYRTDEKHVSYWVEHSMPVVLVLYHPESKQQYWQQVSRDTVKSTGKNWKIIVPKEHHFTDAPSTLRNLSLLTQPEPYIRQLNRLRVDRRWIELVSEGYEVRVQFDDWINKSLPRFQLTISCEDEDESQEWPMVYAPGMDIREILNHYLPWADFLLDLGAHQEGAEGDWDAQCYAGRDSDTGEVFHSKSFEEWYEPAEGIVPVSSNGETESYSLVLTINELGKSFLVVDDFLSEPNDFDKRTFSLE